MNRCERISRASDLYHKLALLEQKLDDSINISCDQKRRQLLMVTRTQMAAIEHQIALIRLLQSENRLRQQLLIAIPSVMGGSAITYLIQKFT